MKKSVRLPKNIWVRRFLLILMAGISLSLSRSPRQHIRILKSIPKEWGKFEKSHIYRLSDSLKKKGYVDHRNLKDGEVRIEITDKGRKYFNRLELEDMILPTKNIWDNKWRLILFDIPETRRRGRDALRKKLKELGCCEVQKSIFAWPYDCRKEINFIVDVFNLENYVIYAEAILDSDSRIRKFFSI